MKCKTFYSEKEAVESFAVPDREYDFVVHKLEAGEEITSHKHDQKEWVIIDDGRVEITSQKRGESHTLTLEPYDENDETSLCRLFLIHIPAGEKHSLKALTEVAYRVYKEKAHS